MATHTSVELEELETHAPSTPLRPGPADQGAQLLAARNTSANTAAATLPKGRSAIVITQLAGINLILSFTNGVITVALPAIAAEIGLRANLLVWPTSVVSLTSGACLLVAGSIADVLGPRSINLAGCFLLACCILACGLSRTGLELVVFRAVQGIAFALIVPSGVSIVSTAVVQGRRRNLGFGVLGLAQPLGFSLGLVLGGVFVDTVGWRTGFYASSTASFLLFVIGIWALPPTAVALSATAKLKKICTDIDWVGAALASCSIAMFSYVLAMLSSNIDSIRQASNPVLLGLSIMSIPGFVFWMSRQVKKGKPALIPNAMWKNAAFSSICTMVLLSYAVTNSMELYCSLFFQEIQGTTALGASLRLLPNLLMGTLLNLLTGMVVDKVSVRLAVLVAFILCAGAPLLMAVLNPHWPYWYDTFFAQLLAPLSGDVIFTVGLLVVSGSFPDSTQALAGAVFNTAAQIGSSIGLTTLSVISATVTKDAEHADRSSQWPLLEGYRTNFWTLFAMMIAACVVGGVGLRKLGKVGMKRD
ncbi:hypothetical protein LTS16_024020 [Friedmanniomyces endolithicus]|nr:hypothetical protein LTR35_017484 [Friedmanniomyces endolithicus]KAK0269422.1 hypothetical protein LTS00_017285 [Friedmanniomyces endolithicus]KAK0302290.1 hypothetical protein LTR01_008851 [Friedmanniomyces endolithicus]KAK0822999.1 hypothetical protein LTR73_008862 [Friedmanniomyces endolithicus]KAK0897950.1 hypothetical protein LTR57_021860 [Friedmanniomyces endolithicus]